MVGAGLTGSATCAMIQRLAPSSSKFAATVWEKSRGAGGRMATSRLEKNGEITGADLGAQYITATKEYRKSHAAYYDELLGADVLRPMVNAKIDGARHKPGDENYVAPAGTASIAKHFLSSSGADARFGVRVSDVSRSKDGRRWTVTSESGEKQEFDALVLTQPVPQLFELTGDVADLVAANAEELKKVEYSSRFAIAAGYAADGAGSYDNMLGAVPVRSVH